MNKYFAANEIINHYKILKIIGEGRYGIVYLAVNDQGKKFVIKQLKKEMMKQTRKKRIYEEQILKKLDYPQFPKFIATYKHKRTKGYILEFIAGKVFEDILVKDKYEFSKEEIYNIGGQLLDLIGLLHENNIVHRDIRPPNVILKENKELALIDFGLARMINNKRYVPEMDYWYLGDFLLYLYYSSYKGTDSKERPWFEELDLIPEEISFLKKLMGIDSSFQSLKEIRCQLEYIKTLINLK